MGLELKKLSLNGTDFLPITSAEAVIVNTGICNLPFNGLITTLDEVLKRLHILYSLLAGTIYTAGFGIKINGNEISIDPTKLNSNLYSVVNEPVSNLVASQYEGQIVVSTYRDSGVADNRYQEYIVIQDNTGDYKWEKIGEIITTGDITEEMLASYTPLSEFNAFKTLINLALYISAEDVYTVQWNLTSDTITLLYRT